MTPTDCARSMLRPAPWLLLWSLMAPAAWAGEYTGTWTGSWTSLAGQGGGSMTLVIDSDTPPTALSGRLTLAGKPTVVDRPAEGFLADVGPQKGFQMESVPSGEVTLCRVYVIARDADISPTRIAGGYHINGFCQYTPVPDGGVFEIRKQTPPALALGLVLNRSTAAPGDLVEVGVTVANAAVSAVAIDAYLVIVPPPAAGPALGCPDGDAFVFVIPGPGFEPLCGVSPGTSFPVLAGNVTIPGGFQGGAPALLRVVWPAGAPAGTYTFAAVATPPGALADGAVDPGDVLAVGAASLDSH